MTPLVLTGQSGFPVPRDLTSVTTVGCAVGRSSFVRGVGALGFVSQNAFVPSARVDPGLPGGLRRPEEGLIQFYEDLVGCAFQLSAAASVVIGLNRGMPGVDASALPRCLPAVPSTLCLILRELETTHCGKEVVQTLTQFSDDLARLRIASAALSPASPDYQGEVERLVSEWRSLAALLARGLSTLAELWPTAIARANTAMARSALIYLEAIATGEPSCLDRSGKMLVPVITENRRHSRSAVNRHAYVFSGSGIQRVLVLDASLQGIGVWGLRGAGSGDKVEILVAPGKRIAGVVSWCSGLRAGITLQTAEVEGSPAFREIIFGNDTDASLDLCGEA